MSTPTKKGAPITASAKPSNNTPLLEAASYNARCYFMAHIGTIDDEYQGKKITSNKVRIGWQIASERLEIERDGKTESLPRVIGKEYTLSLSEKATLRKDLEAWRGVPFSEKELESFDITNILGVECLIAVIQKESKTAGKGKYNVVSSVSKIVKGTVVPPLEGETVLFSHGIEGDKEYLEAFSACPKFVQDQIVTSKEWKERGLERPKVDESSPSNAASAPTDEVSEAENETEATNATEDRPPF